MLLELTNDADKMICTIYKTFLQHRKAGEAKADARRFEAGYFASDSKLSSWHERDLSETLLELSRARLVKIYIGGNFDLTDEGIIYMENRFKNGLNEVVDFISKLMP